jgi:hypothetical protein
MTNQVQSVAIDKLIAHPDNPNRMSKTNFAKLVRNINRTGRYEPLLVRPAHAAPTDRTPPGGITRGVSRNRNGTVGAAFQIINGHHRWQVLKELGYKTADVIVWDIDDGQTDILLATLNRLGGSDVLEKKLALLKRLNIRMEAATLARILPQTTKQIKRLTQLKNSDCTMSITNCKSKAFLNPLVFFVNDKQQEIIDNALSLARGTQNRSSLPGSQRTKAVKNAAALTYVAQHFLEARKNPSSKTVLDPREC